MRIRYTHYLFSFLVVTGVHLSVWLGINTEFAGDELRYLEQASSYLAGIDFYPEGEIMNPPLFPLWLATLQRLGIQIEYLPLSSIVTIILATLLLTKILSQMCQPRWAVAIALIVPLHPAVLMLGSQLMTESYAILLGVISAWLVQRMHGRKAISIIELVALAIVFAALALLKPLFGYALLAALLFTLLLSLVFRQPVRKFLLSMTLPCFLALLLCTPYLMFTYSETGKIFSWGTGTGEHLYWMSIGGDDIWGSWIPDDKVFDNPYLVEHGYADEIASTLNMSAVERDEHLTAIAIERIVREPQDFIRNIIANTTRVLFNYPYSFRAQSLFTYGYIIPNSIFYLMLVFSLVLLPVTLARQSVVELWLLVFFLIYLGGNMLVGSTARQGLVLLGPVIFWMVRQACILIELGIVNPSALKRYRIDSKPTEP